MEILLMLLALAPLVSFGAFVGITRRKAMYILDLDSSVEHVQQLMFRISDPNKPTAFASAYRRGPVSLKAGVQTPISFDYSVSIPVDVDDGTRRILAEKVALVLKWCELVMESNVLPADEHSRLQSIMAQIDVIGEQAGNQHKVSDRAILYHRAFLAMGILPLNLRRVYSSAVRTIWMQRNMKRKLFLVGAKANKYLRRREPSI